MRGKVCTIIGTVSNCLSRSICMNSKAIPTRMHRHPAMEHKHAKQVLKHSLQGSSYTEFIAANRRWNMVFGRTTKSCKPGIASSTSADNPTPSSLPATIDLLLKLLSQKYEDERNSTAEQICKLLGGLPLAITLAAGLIRQTLRTLDEI
jgi:hypothetical protein